MKTSTKIVIAAVSVAVVAGGAVGAFFIIKNINEENHKKDIEMAADCARIFEMPPSANSNKTAYEKYLSNRNVKRQECSEKYHVTHREIIDKIGTEDYKPMSL